jgi:hypothetical protein
LVFYCVLKIKRKLCSIKKEKERKPSLKKCQQTGVKNIEMAFSTNYKVFGSRFFR